MKTVTRYEAGDGSLHQTRKEAEARDAWVSARRLVDHELAQSLALGSSNDVIEFLQKHRSVFRELFDSAEVLENPNYRRGYTRLDDQARIYTLLKGSSK